MKTVTRCPWVPSTDPLYIAYHDTEWGIPVHDDQVIYEFLVLETFQAGLSWRTVLHKRKHFEHAFKKFNPRLVAKFTAQDLARLLKDEGIIRNAQKINAAITNARCFLEIQKEFGSFDAYMWSWVKGKPITHRIRTSSEYPKYIPEAVAWSKDLKRRGFAFLGPTVVYAHMQAVGMVNDHTIHCVKKRI